MELELLTDVNMLLMVEKEIREGIYYAIHRYTKANHKYMENYDRNNESSYIQYLNAKNQYVWEMSQKLFLNGFKWEENTSRFIKKFLKNIIK